MAAGLVVASSPTTALSAEQDQTTVEKEQVLQGETGVENASDPLAKVKNTDLKWQNFDLADPNDSRLNDFSVGGSWMFAPWFKFKYELHYQETDVTGESENDWESLRLKSIFFPKEGKSGNLKYRLAAGVEWILDFDNQDKGIGSGADQIAPFFGVALVPWESTTLVPLVQQFWSYSGEDVNTTSFRLIGLQAFPNKFWGKLDAKVPFDWENDTVPASVELQAGKMFTPLFGAFVEGLFGIGGDKPYDYGFGLGLRFVY